MNNGFSNFFKALKGLNIKCSLLYQGHPKILGNKYHLQAMDFVHPQLTPRQHPSGLQQHTAGSHHHSQVEGTSNPNPPSIGPSHAHRPSQLPLAINPNAGGQIVPSQSHTNNLFLNQSIRAFLEHQNMLNILYQLMVGRIFPVNNAVLNYVAIVYRMWQIEYNNLVNYYKLPIPSDPNKFINGVEEYCGKLVYPYREINNETILNNIKKELEEEFNAQIDWQLQLLAAGAGLHPPPPRPPFPAGQSNQQQIAGLKFGSSGQLIPQQGNQQNISQSIEEVKWRTLAKHFARLGARPSHPNTISNQLPHFNVENLQQILNNANAISAVTKLLLVHDLRMRTLSQQQMRAMPPNQMPFYGANIQPTDQLQIQAQPQRSPLSDRASRIEGSAELPPLPPQIGDEGNEYEQNFDAMQQFLPAADVNQIQQERGENAQGQGNIPTEANETGNEAESSHREGGRRKGVMGNNEQQIGSGHGQGPAQQQGGQQHSGSGGNSSAGSNPSPAGTQK